jgi:hypothetical protein
VGEDLCAREGEGKRVRERERGRERERIPRTLSIRIRKNWLYVLDEKIIHNSW